MKTIEAKKRDLSLSLDMVRKEELVPGIVYGNNIENTTISLPENIVRSAWKNIKDKQEFNLDVEGTIYKVVLQDMQVHVVSGKVLHMDFMVLA